MAVAQFCKLGQRLRFGVELIANAHTQFVEPRGRGLAERLGPRPGLACFRQCRFRGLHRLVGVGEFGFRLGTRICGFVPRRFCGGDGVEQGTAFCGNIARSGFGGRQIFAQAFLAPLMLRNLLIRAQPACLPARPLIGNERDALRARLRFPHQGLGFATALAVGGTRFSRIDAGRGDGFLERHAVAQRSERFERVTFRLACGFAGLGEATDFRLERGQLRSALRSSPHRFCRVALSSDENAAGGLISVFCSAGLLSRRGKFGPCMRIELEQRGTLLLRLREIAFQRGEPVVLRQTHRRGGGRFGRRGISIPAPEVAARRDQPLARLQLRLQGATLIRENHSRHCEPAGQRSRRPHEQAQRLHLCRQRRSIREFAEIAPVMRRRVVGRRIDVVAERRRKGGFVARLHLHRIHQRWPEILRRAQHLGEGAGFRRKPLRLRFHSFQRLARFGFAPFGALQLCACLGQRCAQGFRFARRLVRRVFAISDVGCARGLTQCGIQLGLCVEKLLFGGLDQCRRDLPRALVAGLLRVPLRQIGVQPLKRALALGQCIRQRRGPRLRFAELGLGALRGDPESCCLGIERLDCRLRIGIERALPREILFGLRHALAQPLRLFARPVFLGVQRVALQHEAVQRRAAFRFGLAQGWQLRRRLGLPRGDSGGAVGAFGDLRDCRVERGLGARQLRQPGLPAQMQRQRLGLSDKAGQIAVARRLPRLTPQILQSRFDLADDIVEARHVGLGGPEAKLGFVPALVQAADPRRFLKDGAARQRLLTDQQSDLSLSDEGGRPGAG